jgi:hypothetical protein
MAEGLAMSLVVLVIGFEVYQVLAHAHCFVGRTLPDSHRHTAGFATAIFGDALAYLASGICLYTVGGPWQLLLVPLLAHVGYWCLLVFRRSLYLRIHDYRQRTIYIDGAFNRSKRVAALLDTIFHLLAVLLLAQKAPGIATAGLAAAGVAAYFLVFTRTYNAAALCRSCVCIMRTCRTNSRYSWLRSIILRSPSRCPPPSKHGMSPSTIPSCAGSVSSAIRS